MQTTSALYDSIIATEPHWFETRLIIDTVGTFTEAQLFSISTSLEMFHGSPTIGTAVAGEINVKMLLPSAEIPVMARLRPQVRVRDASRQSEWLPQGVYYIDTRERTKNDDGLDVLTIHGFDAMLKAEADYPSTSHSWPYRDTLVVREIASAMGVSLDSRTTTLMGKNYMIPLPAGYSMREVLGYIASMYAGCFIMSDEGKLRLVSLLELPAETNYLVDSTGDAITFGGDRILV